jgi:hypothetical protein
MGVVKGRECFEGDDELRRQAAEAQAHGKARLGAIDLEVPEAVLQDDGDLGGVARLEMGGDGDAGMVSAEADVEMVLARQAFAAGMFQRIEDDGAQGVLGPSLVGE